MPKDLKDILLKTDGFVFSYRAAGVLTGRAGVLLQKPDNDDGWAFPGGHVAFGETNGQTLRREFWEETGAEISVGRLTAAGEIFFPWGGSPCHQICLFYRVSLRGGIPESGTFLSRERNDLQFRWFGLPELADIKLYPDALKRHLQSGSEDVLHFVSREE